MDEEDEGGGKKREKRMRGKRRREERTREEEEEDESGGRRGRERRKQGCASMDQHLQRHCGPKKPQTSSATLTRCTKTTGAVRLCVPLSLSPRSSRTRGRLRGLFRGDKARRGRGDTNPGFLPPPPSPPKKALEVAVGADGEVEEAGVAELPPFVQEEEEGASLHLEGESGRYLGAMSPTGDVA